MVDAIADEAGQAARPAPLTRRVWRAYAPLAVVWLVYFGAVVAILVPRGRDVIVYDANFVQAYLVSVGGFAVLALVWTFVTKVVLRGDVPFRERFSGLTENYRWLEILCLGTIPALIFVFALMRLFMTFKPMIPELVPFSWDYTFRDWDRVLFLGYDGWELTHALVTSHYGTMLIDRLYVFWFPVVLFTACACMLTPLASRRRLAFFLAFALNWIVCGSVLATVFSSAGPVYFDRVFGDETFVPLIYALMDAEQSYRLTAVLGIEVLWDAHVGIPGVKPYGISAFPSMHVAMAMLVAIYLWSSGQVLRWLGVAFLMAILFGSVHLGWHYLVDGLASIVFCWVLWIGSLRFARWWIPDHEASDA